MALLPSSFNSKDHNTLDDHSAVPAGNYPVQIVKSKMKDTKKKKAGEVKIGSYLEMQMKVIAGKHKGKMFFERLNLLNENATAVEIANKTLATICKAVGVVSVQDSAELHGKPMIAVVAKDEATANNPESNSIKNYKKYTEGVMTDEKTSDASEDSEGGEGGEDSEGGEGGEDKPAKKAKPWD